MATVVMMQDVTNTHIKTINNASAVEDGCIQSFTDRAGTRIEVHYHDTEFMRMIANELLNAADALENGDV